MRVDNDIEAQFKGFGRGSWEISTTRAQVLHELRTGEKIEDTVKGEGFRQQSFAVTWVRRHSDKDPFEMRPLG